MATIDPLRNKNRAFQTKSVSGDVSNSVSLYDIDYAIMTYLEQVVLPKLELNGKSITIPVIYGNSERWVGARRQGVFRDAAGKIQLPLMMIRRTSVAKNESMAMLNRHVTYTGINKWSKDNRYDNFTALTGIKTPKYDVYKITMPDYVEITYECMGWTNYIEHINGIVESLTFASDEYWGDKNKYKFITSITDYNIINEIDEGSLRINRLEFSLNVKAYLLPEKYDGQNQIRKMIGVSKVVTNETDATAGGRIEQSLITPSSYYDNKDLIDFLGLNNTKTELPSVVDVVSFPSATSSYTGIRLVKIPTLLASSITPTMVVDGINYDIKVYVNGVRIVQSNNFTATYSTTTNKLTITFNPANLGYSVGITDEVAIVGRFIELE